MGIDQRSFRASRRPGRSARALWVISFLAALLPANLAAQDSIPATSDTLHLTLSALLDSVQTSHPTVKQGSHATLAAHARRNALGRLLENPTIQAQHTNINSYLLYGLQPIPWPWVVVARRRFGDADIAVANAEAQISTDSVALDAAQRFADALRTQRVAALMREAEKLASASVERAVAARQVGQGGDLTVLQARVNLDAARRAHTAAAESSRVAVAGLAMVLGLDPETPVVLDGALDSLAPISEPDSGYGAQAMGSDPELRRFNAVSLRAKREASMWRAQSRFPHLSFGPSYGWTINPGFNAITGVPNRRLTYLGFNFELDLPIWHGRDAETEEANEERTAAEAGHEARVRELNDSLLNAVSTLARTERQLASLRTGELTRAAQLDSLATSALRQGGPYLTIWLTARQAHIDARRAELDLLWQAARARLVLHYLTGTLLEPPEEKGQGQ